MSIALKWLERAVGFTVLGVVALSGAALLYHSIKPDIPPPRVNLTEPPEYLVCNLDEANHCWIRGRK